MIDTKVDSSRVRHSEGVQLYAEGRFAGAAKFLHEALRDSPSSELANDWGAAELACGRLAIAEQGFAEAQPRYWQRPSRGEARRAAGKCRPCSGGDSASRERHTPRWQRTARRPRTVACELPHKSCGRRAKPGNGRLPEICRGNAFASPAASLTCWKKYSIIFSSIVRSTPHAGSSTPSRWASLAKRNSKSASPQRSDRFAPITARGAQNQASSLPALSTNTPASHASIVKLPPPCSHRSSSTPVAALAAAPNGVGRQPTRVVISSPSGATRPRHSSPVASRFSSPSSRKTWRHPSVGVWRGSSRLVRANRTERRRTLGAIAIRPRRVRPETVSMPKRACDPQRRRHKTLHP
jgi:hypothetical protein